MKGNDRFFGVGVATSFVPRTHGTLSSLALSDWLQDDVSLFVGLVTEHEVCGTATVTFALSQELPSFSWYGCQKRITWPCGPSPLPKSVSLCVIHDEIISCWRLLNDSVDADGV